MVRETVLKADSEKYSVITSSIAPMGPPVVVISSVTALIARKT